ncbi:hypothetical protein [Rubritalea profundi]|uniref:Uncharacterized protein n=1 Tax=Rubritalea profundi TaxID=1658618 RepID=A0A2S7U5I1_9BACT|nr:hypothetical protein [Rubritalea profundi]PQJ29830.1 hypothetical protein BSZ32_15975 [Rubritalea profundi]
MAIPVFIKLLPKLLPAAKLAYDHRDKAVTLYKNIQTWRSKEQIQEPLTIDINPALTTEEQLQELRDMIARRDDIITEQSEILAKLANDLSEISTLTDRLRKRSQWLMRSIYLTLIIMLIRWFFF